MATSLESSLPQVLVIEEIDTSSLKRESLIGECNLYVGPSWMDPIVNFLKQGSFPKDKCEAEKVCRVASHYWLSEDVQMLLLRAIFIVRTPRSRGALIRRVA